MSALSAEVKDGGPFSSEDTGVIDMLESTEEHVKNHTEIMPSSPRKMGGGINSPSAFIRMHAAWAIKRRWKPL